MKHYIVLFLLGVTLALKNSYKDLENNADSDPNLDVGFLTVESFYPGASKQGKEGLCDPDVTQFAGYFNLYSKSKRYFYWFFESRNSPTTDPTFMWLTGGPGCSSIMALFFENGPCSVQDDLTTKINPYSWTSKANGFWVDQPPGTGFSEGELDKNEDDIAYDMFLFLSAFFKMFPHYNRDFFIFGESYAGHYIPAISHYIYEANSELFEGDRIKLSGVAIGNGMTNTEEQYQWYPLMGYNSTTAPQVFNETLYKVMLAGSPFCQDLIHTCNLFDGISCDAATVACNALMLGPYELTGLNVYDMRKECEIPPTCYDFSHIEEYLNQESIRSALNVSNKWVNCNATVYAALERDVWHNVHEKLPAIIEGGVRTLIYVGDVDYICNWIGNKMWSLKLEWIGQNKFKEAKDQEYFVNNKPAGKLRDVHLNGNVQFAFLQVFQSGHMVPLDKPEVSLQMINDFMTDTLHKSADGPVIA